MQRHKGLRNDTPTLEPTNLSFLIKTIKTKYFPIENPYLNNRFFRPSSTLSKRVLKIS